MEDSWSEAAKARQSVASMGDHTELANQPPDHIKDYKAQQLKLLEIEKESGTLAPDSGAGDSTTISPNSQNSTRLQAILNKVSVGAVSPLKTIKSQSSVTNLKHSGFIVTLKENYGFIEAEDHQHEVFFHYSEINDINFEEYEEEEQPVKGHPSHRDQEGQKSGDKDKSTG